MIRHLAVAGAFLSRVPALALRGLIIVYRYGVSPILGPNCRYTPSCSVYTEQAIRQHGALHGGWLGLCRLCRCHPWGGSGYDPVPAPGPAMADSTIAGPTIAGPTTQTHSNRNARS